MSNIIPFKSFAERPESEIALLHSPFYPAELYEGEQATATLTKRDSNSINWEFRVWRISPLGVELLVENQAADQEIQYCNKVDLKVRIGNHVSEFSGLVVTSRHVDRDKKLIGIRWYVADEAYKDGSVPAERRKADRWLCGVDFLPTGIAPNPIRFNDFVHFRIRDLSLSGMQLLTSLRNKLIIPGMHLDSVVSLPLTGSVKFKLRIKNTRIVTLDGRDYLSLGVVMEGVDEKVLSILGQYIFQFGPKTSIQELTSKGFRIAKPSVALEYGYVRTAEDYEEVLALRKMAYSGAGKVPEDAPSEATGDIFDTRARILTARYRGQLVATARIMFHNPEDNMEHERFFKLPQNFPRKDEIVELTRICTHPQYRGSDLFFGIIRHITLTVAQSNRNWILGSAEPKLVPLYTRLGYRKTDVSFQHADLANLPHVALLGNVQKMLSGVGVSVDLWNELYSELSHFIKDKEIIDFDPFLNLRMNVYRALKPVTALFTKGLRKPRTR